MRNHFEECASGLSGRGGIPVGSEMTLEGSNPSSSSGGVNPRLEFERRVSCMSPWEYFHRATFFIGVDFDPSKVFTYRIDELRAGPLNFRKEK